MKVLVSKNRLLRTKRPKLKAVLLTSCSMLAGGCETGGGTAGGAGQDTSAVVQTCFHDEIDARSKVIHVGRGAIHILRDRTTGEITGLRLPKQDYDQDSFEVRVDGQPVHFASWNDFEDVTFLSDLSQAAKVEISYCVAKKTQVCHRPPGNPENEKTLLVGGLAYQAHLAHGDVLGQCANETPEPEPTPNPSPTVTAAPGPEPTPEPTASPTPTPEPTASPTPEPTASPAPEPTASPAPEPTASPTPEPTASPTPTPTPTATASPTPTPTPTPTASPDPGSGTNTGTSFSILGFDAATTSNMAYLIWYTPDAASTSQVYWGDSPQLANMSFVDTTMTTQHSVVLGGLVPNTTYYFQAVSVDAQGRVSYSSLIMKTTKPLQ